MRRARGFTLVEVVVAFVLLALVLAVGFEVFSSGLRRAGTLEDRSAALEVAQSQLARAGLDIPLKEGQVAGQSDDGKYQWTVAIARFTEGEDPNQALATTFTLYRIEATVRWAQGDGREASITLATLELGSVL